MKAGELITCSICGYSYDPLANASCSTCPLHRGCELTCCPRCGVNNINPAGSTLVQLFKKLRGAIHHDQLPGANT